MLGFLIAMSVLIDGEAPKKDFVLYEFPEGKRYFWVRKREEVYFDFDSAKLKEEEKEKLKKFKKGDRVILWGQASPEGSKSYNYELSKKRAESVKEFLEKLGVKVKEVKVLGEFCLIDKKDWKLCRKVSAEGF